MYKLDAVLEGQYLSERGTLINTYYVDGRDPDDRTPIATLVKASEKRFMIRRCRTVRITPPPLFREEGVPFIRDHGEGFTSYIEKVEEVVDNPKDLAEARLMNEAQNRSERLASKSLGEGPHRPRVITKTTTRSIRRTEESGRSIWFGKRGWVFCASVLPEGEDYREWKLRMRESGYEEESYIYSPREFARALAEMVAEQIGPSGPKVSLKSVLGGITRSTVTTEVQSVYHGPMIYTDDVYALLDGAETDEDYHLLSIFAKNRDHSHQREYRFTAWSGDEPALEHRILNACPRLLLSMEEQAEPIPALSIPPAETPPDPDEQPVPSRPAKRRGMSRGLLDSFDFNTNPTTPMIPGKISHADLPEDLAEMTTEYSAVSALISKVDEVSVSRRVRVASAAFYAERFIRQLCAEFIDPIKHIFILESDDIVVEISFPNESNTKGVFVVTPEGTASFELEAPRTFPRWTRGSSTESSFISLLPSDIEMLTKFGLPVRSRSSAR